MRFNPNFEYFYYSDSIHNPYGDKAENEILSIIDSIVVRLIQRGCLIIVIACNTASAIGVSYLREKYPEIIFIAIEPAIKLAYSNDCGSGTLIMVTKGTLESKKFHSLYEHYHRSVFYLLPCVDLANLIEVGEMEAFQQYLVKNLSPYKGRVSSVILGCTHYPIIKGKIKEILGDVAFYDGSLRVAQQLEKLVLENGFVGTEIRKFYFLILQRII